MNTTNNGGPAFPSDRTKNTSEGLTLRDYFAAKAMEIIMNRRSPDDAAIEAYEYADAMLRAREAA